MKAMLLIACLVVIGSLVDGHSIEELTAATLKFSSVLYKLLALDVPNCIYSPYSIHSAMSVACLGARTSTEAELIDKLRLSNFVPPTSFHQAYRDLISQFAACTDVTLNTASGLFINPAIHISPVYVNNAAAYYKARVSNFNLTVVEGPEKEINDFVEAQTHGQIQGLIPQGAITPQTSMILVHALFVNGTWKVPFNANLTQKGEFFLPDGSFQMVDMMHDERYVYMKRNFESADVVELPFSDQRFCMVFVVCQDYSAIAELESALTDHSKLEDLFLGLTLTRVKLSIPKFRISSEFTVRAPLSELGITKAFDSNIADFTGVDPSGSSYIEEIYHKADIEITETGTYAPSATGVVVGATSSGPPTQEIFAVDRSFLAYLRDNRTKQILYVIKYTGQHL